MELIKVGDIVEHTGGYNCTQTQFYLVRSISKTGKKATISRLRARQASGDWMNGAIEPVADKPDTEEHIVMVKPGYNDCQMLRGRINHTVRDKETGEVKWVNRGSIEDFRLWNGKPIWNNCD